MGLARLLALSLSWSGLFACAGGHTAAPAAESGVLAAAAAVPAEAATPPFALQRPHEVRSANGSRNDPYFWLRDDTRKDPDVLGYLQRENDYAAAVMAPLAPLEEALFAEMRKRLKEDDSTVPTLDEGYWYYTRFEAGKQQPIHARRRGTLEAPEEVLLDGNQLASGHAFYRIAGYQVSRDGKLLAYADDVVGRNQFRLHIKDLATGELLPDSAENIASSLVWANDNRTLFFVGKDATTLREDRVFRHVLGQKDELIFEEHDGSYYVSLQRTKSRRYIEIVLSSTTNSEVRLIDADRPTAPERVFLARSKDHLYQIDHLDGAFIMRTNRDAKNFRLVRLRDGAQAEPAKWVDVIPHRADGLVEDFAVYRGFVAASVRTAGLLKVEVAPNDGARFFLDAADPTYTMTVDDTPDASSSRVRYSYDSLTTPTSIYELDVPTRERRLLKQVPVPSHDPARYASEYLHARASDGTEVPISVVYRKDTARDGTAPILVMGYGSYGISSDPQFRNPVVSLLDRGWLVAIAHVRGGQEKGRGWYEDGKLMHKRNTFTDFIAASEYLVAARYGARARVFAMGGSAGGMLMGAVLNLRPDLYRGVAALVPFVDVVTTMLDTSIPLTTNEFDEWGNPQQKEAYEYMLSYSPYDNVKAQAYPSIYVRTGLWDSQVQYFEPAKWVAKLRANKLDKNLLVMDVEMSQGHGGASGRFDRLRQTARTFAFLLHVNERPDARTR
jgi:oligopeptidase B